MFRSLIVIGVLLGALACDGIIGEPMTEPVDDLLPEQLPSPIVSSKQRVRFKGGERWANDLARALGLARSALCQEVGGFDCVSVVHGVALGGVEPYELRVDEPLPIAPVTAPIAVDRIAMTACSRRLTADLAQPSASVIFSGLEGDAGRRLSAARLVERLLNRAVSSSEVDMLAAFYDDVSRDSTQPERDWAVLTCMAIATGVEALFY